jgi:hypothetical protein
MTIRVSPTRPSDREFVATLLHDTIKELNDRVVLTTVFVALFLLNYAGSLIDAVANISTVENDLTHSLTASGARKFSHLLLLLLS